MSFFGIINYHFTGKGIVEYSHCINLTWVQFKFVNNYVNKFIQQFQLYVYAEINVFPAEIAKFYNMNYTNKLLLWCFYINTFRISIIWKYVDHRFILRNNHTYKSSTKESEVRQTIPFATISFFSDVHVFVVISCLFDINSHVI